MQNTTKKIEVRYGPTLAIPSIRYAMITVQSGELIFNLNLIVKSANSSHI